MPASIAADWLTSTWDQNAGLYVAGPSASVVEEVAGAGLIELPGLPSDASFGFVTGGQTAQTSEDDVERTLAVYAGQLAAR